MENDDGFIQVPDKHPLQWNNRDVMLTSWVCVCVCVCVGGGRRRKINTVSVRHCMCVCLPLYQSPEVEQGHWLFSSPSASHLTPFVLGPPLLYLAWGGWVVGGTLLDKQTPIEQSFLLTRMLWNVLHPRPDSWLLNQLSQKMMQISTCEIHNFT